MADVERTGSSATVNESLMINNNVSTSTTPTNTLLTQRHITSSRQQLVTRPLNTTTVKDRNINKHGAAAVKLWLLKGMVRLPSNGTESRTNFQHSASTQSTLPLPETSRLIGGSSSNMATSPKDGPDSFSTSEDTPSPYTFSRHAIRSNYMDKSIEAKKKVIRMLFVVVAEFFVCWAPLHVLNTWYLFSPEAVYKHVGSTGISLVQLLAYISSCCNPITYCFMNRKFRQAFLGIFDCYRCTSWLCGVRGHSAGIQRTGAASTGIVVNNNSDLSCNDSTQFVGRISVAGRSEVVVLEAEDRV
ncbi:cholecystokinin receptor type A-like isoform X2 [Anabrus simplex]|uniref:cholecystokinin receptor type A-like isoform X2 n=1 Tax=Anabrus simplex TaxID=316456 RepID=UPI0035A2ABEB